jgi:hypothetical protein
MSFPQRLQVKQYVAEVRGRHARFRVFETGDSRFYLFDMLDPSGCSTCIQVPVRKADLQPDVRRALRHGVGHPR